MTPLEIAKALRCCSQTGDCPPDCPRRGLFPLGNCIAELKTDAACCIEILMCLLLEGVPK